MKQPELICEEHSVGSRFSHELVVPLVNAQAATVADGISLSTEEGLVTLGHAPFPEDEPWWKKIAPTTLYALAAGGVALLFLLHELIIAGKLGFPLDEGWAHLVYARNFFHHVAFEFNIGERTPGPAAPFWTVFVAFASALLKNPIIASKVLGSIFLFLAAYYGFRLLRSLEFDYGSSIIAGLLVVSIPSLAWAELAGIEATLSAALVVAGLWSYVLALRQDARYRGARRYLTGLVFGLATLARPEAAIILLIVLAHWSVEHLLARAEDTETQSFRSFWRDISATSVGFLLLILPISITNQALSGSLLPPSIYAAFSKEALPLLVAKADYVGILLRLVFSFNAIPALFFHVLAADQPVLFVAILVAATLLLRRRTLHSTSTVQFFALGVSILVFFPYFYALFLGSAQNYGEHAHQVLALSGVYYLTGFVSLRIIAEGLALRGPSNRTLLLFSTAILLVGGVLQLILNSTRSQASYSEILPLVTFAATLAICYFVADRQQSTGEHGTRTYLHNPREFERLTLQSEESANRSEESIPQPIIRVLRALLLLLLAWNVAMLVPNAREYGIAVSRENRGPIALAHQIGEITPPTSTIATNAIGALGYFSDRKIFDINGRLQSGVVTRKKLLGTDLGLLDELAAGRPEYLVLRQNEDSTFISLSLETSFLKPIATGPNANGIGERLYEINYTRLDELAATVALLPH